MCEVPAVNTLHRVWVEQYTEVDEELIWRDVKAMPSSVELIASPYDPQARYSTKRGEGWVGYKVHLTETCDETMPHFIVNMDFHYDN